MGPVCLPNIAQDYYARLPASTSSSRICPEEREGSPLAVLGGDGRYTQIGVGCTEPGDTGFYTKYSSLTSPSPGIFQLKLFSGSSNHSISRLYNNGGMEHTRMEEES